jgi:uncharacterized protein
MDLEWDDEKRRMTLERRKLDFADAVQVFSGRHLTIEDDSRNYGELRLQAVGRLSGTMVMVVWTPRGNVRRVISMRKCNERERARYGPALDRPG